MKRLILHIGFEKTGSSALQRFFARNRSVLRMMGVRYPRVTAPDGTALEKHQDLVEVLTAEAAGRSHEHYGSAEAIVAGYAERAAAAPITVLSAEGLSAPTPHIAQSLATLGQQFDVRVVAFLRRQDEWALSAYRQAIMDGSAGTAGIAAWLATPQTQARMDYDTILAQWEAAFGHRAVKVLRYPHDIPVVPAFVAAADLPRPAALLPQRLARVNESAPDADVLAALEAAGAAPILPELDQPARDALLDSLQPSNRAVRDRYFPQARSLFGMK